MLGRPVIPRLLRVAPPLRLVRSLRALATGDVLGDAAYGGSTAFSRDTLFMDHCDRHGYPDGDGPGNEIICASNNKKYLQEDGLRLS